jgi:hypothetical protein
MSVAHTPITTSRQVEIPKGHRIYTSTRRQCAVEMPVPTQGAAVGTFLGGIHAANIVLNAWDSPTGDGKKSITIEHTTVPSGISVSHETVAFQFPPIYPNGTAFFPGGSYRRPRNVIGRITYEFSRTPASTWGTAPAIWDFSSLATGPFEVRSYLADASGESYSDDDGNSGTIGGWLKGNFVASDTIHDSVTISVPGVLFYSIVPSVPSATQYAAWVAAQAELIVSRTVDDWYGDISMRRTVYVKAQ